MEPLLIPITIKPAPLHNIDIELSATQAKIGETVKGTIFLTDIRGNRILNETDIIFTYNSGLATSFPLNNTLTVPAGQGQRAFTLSGKVGGMGYLIANAKNNTNVVPGIAEITFQEPLFPSTSGLNIMYLNYFGSDRGNQR
ncbi:MAG: hypothetical protein LBP53_08515 [Candidatus Peribacteria bacterium]|nr:hypothetical protein [Candidatus Peribacteria bacterium]